MIFLEENWQDNPKLAGMDRSKLDMLQQMAQQGAGKSPSDLLPFIMNAAAKGKSAGLPLVLLFHKPCFHSPLFLCETAAYRQPGSILCGLF